ncbi:hypothetical protein GCM10010336_42270 [Streptomyces goshikiensis]|nr:hypothetical protein GCM10010336_42270 [Streptomyces goshikiensis]
MVQRSTARTATAVTGMFEPFCIACVMPVILPSRARTGQCGPPPGVSAALSPSEDVGMVHEGYLNFMCLRNS